MARVGMHAGPAAKLHPIMIDLCYDDLGEFGLGYPNLAAPGLEPWEFDTVFPRSVPFRLLVYMQQHCVAYAAHQVSHCPRGSFYPVALAWFDHDCDYFSLLSPVVLDLIRQRHIRVLFYYHEGDNPLRIKQRLDALCGSNSVPQDCYLFVSANSASEKLDGFVYFDDHEHFFRYLNRRQLVKPADLSLRTRQFTALNRTHKWWRATIMTELSAAGILDHSYWSYNTEVCIDDDPTDNPIRWDQLPGIQSKVTEFLRRGPYRCDAHDQESHNDHRDVNEFLFRDAWCHLVVETLFDADGSGGCFLTEKTFKPIKFGQPFVLIGAVGSVATLRDRGYDVFDQFIDNSYDTIPDNTKRWLACRDVIQSLHNRDLAAWYRDCLPGVLHNQEKFMQDGRLAIIDLIRKIKCET